MYQRPRWIEEQGRAVEGESLMGFWDWSTPAMRVCFFGFCGAVSAFLIGLIGEWLQSDVLAYVSVGIMVVSVGVGFWAVWFGRHLS